MARDRNNIDEDREIDSRHVRLRRERPWGYEDPYAGRGRSLAGEHGHGDFGRGRFGERAEYDSDEPKCTGYSGRSHEEDYRRPSYDQRREYPLRRPFAYEQPARYRLRCRDIMTRDLAVATRDTTLREVALMMKEEDQASASHSGGR